MGNSAMGMGMGAGFGMMMPNLIQQAMQARPPQAGASTAPATAAPAVGVAAGAAAAAGGGLDFGELAPQAVDPKQLVRAVAQSSGWQLQESADAFQVQVPIGAPTLNDVNRLPLLVAGAGTVTANTCTLTGTTVGAAPSAVTLIAAR